MNRIKNTIHPIWVVCLLLASTAAHAISLEQALAQHKITARYTYNTESVHYEKPVLAHITNLTNSALRIEIPVGTIFQPADDGEQDIIVSTPEVIALRSKESTQHAIHGKCIESDDAAGEDGSTFSLQHKTDNSDLLAVLKYLDEKKITASLAQKAVWCITNKHGLEEIYDLDDDVANDLRTYIAELTDQPLPEPETMNDYRYSYDATPAMTVFGTINLQFSRTADVQIAMFNKGGVIVRELFRFENLTPGPHRLKYTFDNSVYTDDEYTVKVIRNGDVLLKRVIRMG